MTTGLETKTTYFINEHSNHLTKVARMSRNSLLKEGAKYEVTATGLETTTT